MADVPSQLLGKRRAGRTTNKLRPLRPYNLLKEGPQDRYPLSVSATHAILALQSPPREKRGAKCWRALASTKTHRIASTVCFRARQGVASPLSRPAPPDPNTQHPTTLQRTPPTQGTKVPGGGGAGRGEDSPQAPIGLGEPGGHASLTT